jgi:HK97 family phage portal protein
VLFDSFFETRGRSTTFSPASDSTLWMGNLAGSGVSVTPDSALKYSVVYACIRILSSHIAGLPIDVFANSADGKIKTPKRKHTTYKLLAKKPNSEQTAFNLRQAIVTHLMLHGNAYVEIARQGNGKPANLWLLPPERTKPFRTNDGTLRYELRLNNSKPVEFAPSDVLHFRLMSRDGIVGLSPIQQARESIGLGLATQKYGAEFFGKGAVPQGIITTPEDIGPDKKKRWSKDWSEAHSNSDNAHRIAIFDRNVKFQGLSIPQKDAQFLETRVHQVRDVARIFGVPPNKLADLADATYSNVEEENRAYVVDTLLPLIVNIEAELNSKIFMDNETNFFVKHNISGLLRAKDIERNQSLTMLLMNGVINRNEFRALLDRNPIENGDEYLVPVNLQLDGNMPQQEEPQSKDEEKKGLARDLDNRHEYLEQNNNNGNGNH